MSRPFAFVLLSLAVAGAITLGASMAAPATIGATVKSVASDGSQITVSVGSGKTGKEETLKITGATKISLDGKPFALKELAVGTKVTLSYDKASREVVTIKAVSTAAQPADAPASEAAAPKAAKKAAAARPGAADAKAPVSAGEWPQWRGPERNGVSKETGLLKRWPEGGPPLAWTASGLGSGLSSVAITGGRIFTAGDRGN